MTREELYSLVWSEPLSTLASRFHFSAYALRKLCIELSIPLPRAGHWRQARTGVEVPIPPLPPLNDKQRLLSFSAKSARPLEEEPVPAPRRPLDPLLAAVKEALSRKEKAYLRDGLRHSDTGQLDVRVAPANIDRALRFMSHLLQAVRAAGYSIEGSRVVVAGQKMNICCREKLKRVTINDRPWQRTELVPTGTLAFQLIPEFPWNAREWKEGTETLEQKIPTILEKMEIESRRLAEEERERKIRQARWAEEERIQKEQEQKKQAEFTSFQSLLTQTIRWRRAKDLREYLDAFELHARTSETLTTEREAWLAWARAKVNWYDPFLEAPDEWLSHINRDSLH